MADCRLGLSIAVTHQTTFNAISRRQRYRRKTAVCLIKKDKIYIPI